MKPQPDVPPPAPANFIRPGKRPLSSMSPTIVLKDGKVKAAVGASGGLYHSRATQLKPNKILYEDWRTVYNDHFELPKETRDVLEKKGHVLTLIADGAISQLIVVESGGNSNGTNRLVAVSDPRKGGYGSSQDIKI
ncbi:hypothetical protein DY000_02009160 [Brassica cretica]|uniref:Uncharacterized protein n=1 Tax=Brassica cretica TaxID=69181 RepID=A0ABQ7C4Z3_BRACR|nr:hypothetical protein DY000_02009160 [Brassica cretica]